MALLHYIDSCGYAGNGVVSGFRWQWSWLAVFVNGHVGQVGVGHENDLVRFLLTLGKGLDVDRHRGAADTGDRRITADHIADKYRLPELK